MCRGEKKRLGVRTIDISNTVCELSLCVLCVFSRSSLCSVSMRVCLVVVGLFPPE